MPLTHVCVWDSKIGYRRITVEEACKMYPYGASARSGHFVCELCAQNVLLTAPGMNVQHFRHDPASPNKECDERQASFVQTTADHCEHLQPYNAFASCCNGRCFSTIRVLLPPRPQGTLRQN